MHQGPVCHAGHAEALPRILKPAYRVAHEIGITLLLVQNTVHALEDPCVDIPRHIPEIGGDPSFDQRAVDHPFLMIHLFHDPDSPRDGDLVPHGRGLDDGAEFL